MLLKHYLSSAALGTCAIASLAVVAPSAQAATVLTRFETFGSQMAGMEITVNFLDGSSETNIWQNLGSVSGGAFGSNWNLTQSGNTFNSPWTFNYGGINPITSLVIDAVPGNTLFDISPALGLPNSTPGSSNGNPFSLISGQAPTSFNYSVPIDISVGDLFGKLTLNWDTGFSAGSFAFLADTDNGTVDNPVTPVDPDPVDPDPVDPDPVSVPEPGLLLGFFGLGVLGIKQQLQQRTNAA